MACGAYTPVLVPELDGLCEATAGSVVVFQIPKTSPLFTRLAPENFPFWMYNMRSGSDGGLYEFPVDSQGLFKIVYRGTKYTDPQLQRDGKERSVPVTRYTRGESVTKIPAKAMIPLHHSWQTICPKSSKKGTKLLLPEFAGTQIPSTTTS
ncbi:hypothetical protein QQZ08_008339 [Neonectria magnoliae]|uniref:Uncharacterized protein n=1 Tax=Neonectria magnoliae TaxID=2732573 RepID=A0ABR1HUW9_9HYPO